MLELNDVSHVYANGTRALHHVTLSIPRGMYGLLGPNGAGKSTLTGSVHQLTCSNAQSLRQPLNNPNRGVSGSTFYVADIGPVDICLERECLLRPALFLPEAAQVLSEASTNIHPPQVRPVHLIGLQMMSDNEVDLPATIQLAAPVTHRLQVPHVRKSS